MSTTMSLARALTKRAIMRSETPEPLPARTASARKPGQQINRAKISSPVALVSTTNMLSYNAPDIATMRHASSSSFAASSHSSAEDSDNTSTSGKSQDTLTDASSVESSPTSPEPNHLSCYFNAAQSTARRSASSGDLRQLHRKSSSIDGAPAVPQRALSHSKKAHEVLARKRSLQNIGSSSGIHSRSGSQNMGPPNSMHTRATSREHRTSVEMFSGSVDQAHPFGKELEQLNEVVEEFGGAIRDATAEADFVRMKEKGLKKFCANDYLMEIQPLFNRLFEPRHHPVAAGWI